LKKWLKASAAARFPSAETQLQQADSETRIQLSAVYAKVEQLQELESVVEEVLNNSNRLGRRIQLPHLTST
jgi:hypothetical protein